MAKSVLQAYMNGTLEQELETLDLNLPPGALQKAIKKAGIGASQITEKDIFKRIQQLMQQQSAVVVAPVDAGVV